jgi:hypothetical protein
MKIYQTLVSEIKDKTTKTPLNHMNQSDGRDIDKVCI